MDGEFELLSDSKYRGYVSQVEKVLRNFESTAEWADLISALGKLNKVLQSNAKYDVIPKRGIIGKRLAQCLHPALPSGVHLKALETYSIIFKAIGKQGLKNDLFTYSSGLFPLLGYAAMNVKPSLLSLYEDYYLELGESVKPALNGLLLGLLPGLEEGSEHYDRTSVLLERFCKAAGPPSFYGSLWECVLISPNSRLPAIMFVIQHYNKRQTMEDQLQMMGTNIDVMVQALCMALQDSSVLVQRNFLDFLLLGFTMNNKQLNRPDMTKLVQAAVHTLLRRDMSLNRRLFVWFLGQGMSGIPAPQAVVDNQAMPGGVPFFNHFSRDILICAIKNILDDFTVSDGSSSERSAHFVPFRILISMLDKPEVGPAIIEEVMIDIFRCLYRECTEPKNGNGTTNGKKFDEKCVAELIKTANLLFGALEPNYLWDFIARRFEEVYVKHRNGKNNQGLTVIEFCSLVDFLLDRVSLETYPETQTEYLPDLLLRLTAVLTKNCLHLMDQEIIDSLLLEKKILTKVHPSMMLEKIQAAENANAAENAASESSTDPVAKSPSESAQDSSNLIQACVSSYQQFYSVFISKRIFSDYPLKEAMGQILSKDEKPVDSPPRQQRARSIALSQSRISSLCCEAIEKACQLLVEYSTFPTYCREHKSLVEEGEKGGDATFPDWVQALLTCCVFSSNFYVLTSSVSTMLDLIGLTSSVVDENPDERGPNHGTVSVVIMPSLTPTILVQLNENSNFYTVVAERLWSYLDAGTPEYHQRAVELLYQLHQMSPSAWTCEDVISKSLMSSNMPERVEAFQRYSTLWHITRNQKTKLGLGGSVRTFDRSMFIMLDSLLEDTDSTRALASTWLTHALQRGDVGRLMEPILLLLLHPESARVSIQHVDIHETRRTVHSDIGVEDDVETRIYAISSEGGNVIYHIGSDNQGKMKVDSPEVRSLSVMNIGRKTKSATSVAQPDTDMAFERVDARDLKLRVNPFGSETSLDKLMFEGKGQEFPDVERVRRLDKETCRKEGISFDDENSGDETDFELVDNDESHVDMVNQIIEEVLLQVFTQVEESEAVELQVSSIEASMEEKQSLHEFGDDDFLSNIDEGTVPIDEPIDSGGEAHNFVRSSVHPLHTHLLIYLHKYDCKRTLYAMHAFKTMLMSNPRQLIFAMSTTSINAVRTPHLMQLQDLLVRHRGCIFGKNFFGDLDNDAFTAYRTTMYAELMISVCLYYVRSYYTNLMCGLEQHEVISNKEVQIMSCDILSTVLAELVNLLKDSGKTFATYLTDLLNRCKVQKAVLHCLLASVYDSRRRKKSSHVTEAIVSFNEMSMNTFTNETFQIKLVRLVLVIIVLEDQLKTQRGDTEPLSSTSTDWERNRGLHNQQTTSVKFLHAQPVATQPMMLTTILGALKQQHMCHMHRHWIELVVMVMPFVGRALGPMVTSVVEQLCRNIEYISTLYDTGAGSNGHKFGRIPADHVLTVLEGMTTMCHYCLMDSTTGIGVNRQFVNISETGNSGQIFSNLINVFTPHGGPKDAPHMTKDQVLQPAMASVVSARRGLLSILPRIISSLSSLWRAIHLSEQCQKEKEEQPSWTMGYPKAVRQLILEFLSPISVHHNANLLAAFAVVWNDKRKKESLSLKKYIPSTCPDQLLLVDLVSSIRVLPPDTLVQTVKQVIKTPPPTSQDKNKKRTPLEVSMLQFFYAYVQKCTTAQLIDCWPSLLSLIKDGLLSNLTPPGQFLLLLILNEFVQKTPPFEDRKDHRDVQELSQKLLELCSNVAGSTLEQTTWFRRNLAVKISLQKDLQKLEGEDESLSRHTPQRIDSINSAQYSVHALLLLAELTAPLLDIVYGSDEKEKIVPFLTTSIMYNVFPYLKHHSIDNAPCYRACSQILASLSGYQYTRKAWKKEVFDLFVDSNFFKMTRECMPFWKTIIDNLMTHDKITFRDLLVRFASQSTSTIHVFSSREAEHEQRALLLKKLSYTIFCSETDQYQRYMPDIQEKLSESLKFSQAPVIHAQVFLCFRVLMLRISPQHLTSLWPTIITELVHVFLQLEQELSADGEDMKIQLQRMAAVESNFVFSRPNSQNNPKWLSLYLSACKLLDLALVMPASLLPQFQVYRWAFIGEDDMTEQRSRSTKSKDKDYVPHCVKVAESLNKRYGSDARKLSRPAGYPMLTIASARTMQDLHPFFATLNEDKSKSSIPVDSENHQRRLMTRRQSSIPKSKSAPELSAIQNDTKLDNGDSWRDFVESLIEADFLDPIPTH